MTSPDLKLASHHRKCTNMAHFRMFMNSSVDILPKMIEFCTVKRMVLLATSLVILCIVVLAVENALTKNTKHTSMSTLMNLTGKENCWLRENYMIKEECRECSNFEKVSRHLPVCLETGFKELVTCDTSGDSYKSCPRLTWMEKRNFWMFEMSTVAVGGVSWIVVFLRQKQLEYRMLQRIQKQISAGV